LAVYAQTVVKPFAELALIDQIRATQAARMRRAGKRARANSPAGLILGIGDDCAVLRPPPGHEVLVTTDFTLEGRHFLRKLHPPESVGHRVLACGLSDLAAMGAKPLAGFLSLALSADLVADRKGRDWLARFFAGFNALAHTHSVPLAGGDTSESPSDHILADIVLLGSAPKGRALRRSTARSGDVLYVTGALGGSAAELASLQQRGKLSTVRLVPSQIDPNLRPHLYPQPRLGVGKALLRRRLATACIDLSDGLSTDLAHLCHESDLGAEIAANALPIHPLAARTADPLLLALHGGEDYELLFAAPPSARIPRSIAGVSIARVGTLTRRKAITLMDAHGQRKPLIAAGWEHFTRAR
jgi:thiamine-monophosphate kinase